VEIGMIIDMFTKFGAGALAQVDLGVRLHRHHKLETLAIQAAEVAATVLSRTPNSPTPASVPPTLRRKTGDPIELNLGQRPPANTLPKLGVIPQSPDDVRK
jgi:glucosyl-3-phosphoglycerate synthase